MYVWYIEARSIYVHPAPHNMVLSFWGRRSMGLSCWPSPMRHCVVIGHWRAANASSSLLGSTGTLSSKVCTYVCMYVWYGIVPWLCSWKHHEWYHILFYSADSLSLRGSLHLELACRTTKVTFTFFSVVASHMCNKKIPVRTNRFNYLRPCVFILNEIIFPVHVL